MIMATLLPFNCSILCLPRIITEPRPVLAAESYPALPRIIPPVGKSGPGMIFIISSMVMSLFSIYAKQPSIVSPKL